MRTRSGTAASRSAASSISSEAAWGIKVLARTHKTLIRERTGPCSGCGYFPAALEAFEDLDAPELLGKAPEPTREPKLRAAVRDAKKTGHACLVLDATLTRSTGLPAISRSTQESTSGTG